MSTRCNVRVRQVGLDWKEEVQLYHHWDGYPSNMLPLLAKGYSDQLLRAREDAKRLKLKEPSLLEMGRAGYAASMIIAADVNGYQPESGPNLHGDIEYLYVVEVVNKGNGTLAEKPQWYVTVYTSHGSDKFWDDPTIDKLKVTLERTEVLAAAEIAKEVQERG